MWCLIVEMEGKRIGSFDLKEGENTVGRSKASDVHVNAPDISRTHAKIMVAGDEVTLENLGKSGTRLAGVPAEGACRWRPDQSAFLGALAELRLICSDEADAVPVDSQQDSSSMAAEPVEAAKTGSGAQEGAIKTANEPLAGASEQDSDTSEGVDADEPAVGDTQAGTGAFQTHRSMTGAGDGGGQTRAMQTRMVSPEELEDLRAIEQGKTRKRMMISAAIGLPLLILIIVFRPRTLPPETEIVWPRDTSGAPLQTVEPAQGSGAGQAGFDVLIPGNRPIKKTAIEGGFVVETVIGREGDVPFRMSLQEHSDPRFAPMSRAAMVREWINEPKQEGEIWSFDRPYTRLGFYGFEQGVPFTRVPYQRQEGQTLWHGVANLFRHGQRRYCLRAELPASERWRAERMLFMRYAKPSISFERSHWESTSETLEKASMDAMLARARRDLTRVAPLTWARVASLLKAALVKAVATDDPVAYREALDMLVGLRERQARWFNSQALARDNALAQGDDTLAARIAELAKAVFPDADDYRYYRVRRW